MKHVEDDKKRFGVLVIITALMVSLIIAERVLESNIRYTSLVHNNINALNQYDAMDGRFKYKLPDQWEASKDDQLTDGLLYRCNFKSQDAKIYGFVEVWKERDEVSMFIPGKECKVVNESDEKLKNGKFHTIEYTFLNSSQMPYRACEYYMKKDGVMIRYAFFTREANYREDAYAVYKTMVENCQYVK